MRRYFTSVTNYDCASPPNMSRFWRLNLLAASVLAATFPVSSMANTGSADYSIEEVVVTARKRGNETLQDLGASVSAISEETLSNMGVTNFQDFAYQVPGLTFDDAGPGEKRYVIRGIQSAGQQQVAVYYDEVPLPGVQGSGSDTGAQTTDLKMFDMERVEVLKGPQGTTFGANSQSGTVRFISKKPNLSEVEGSLQLDYSSTKYGSNSHDFNGFINIPLIEDKLGARVVAYKGKEGGYIDNVRLGLDDINWIETKGIRGALRYQPSDFLTIDAMVWLQERESGGASRYHPYDTYGTNPLGDFASPSTSFQTGEFNVGDYTTTEKPDDQTIYSLTADWDLGWANMVATGSYYKRDFGFKFDSTWIILFLGAEGARDDLWPALTDQEQSIEQKAFEVRFNSTADGPLQWMGGYFQRSRESEFQSYVPVVNAQGEVFDPGTPFTGPSMEVGAGIAGCHPCVFARVANKQIDEKALFGEVSYAFNDQWEATLGLRWFDVEQSDFGATVFQFALFSDVIPPDNIQSAEEDQVIKKVQLSYHATDDILLYGVVSEGYRLGGTNNQGIVAVPALYAADKLTNYEFGVKSTLADGRLIVNASVFRANWEDMQVSGTDPTGGFRFLGNAGEARVDGIELDVIAKPSAQWDLTAGLSYLPTRELIEDQRSTEVIASGVKGDKIPRIPELTFNATAQYNFDLSEAGDWGAWVRGEYSYKGKSNTELRTDSANNREQDAFDILNLRMGFFNESNGTDVIFFLENALDERADINIRAAAAQPTSKITNRPRTIGVSVNKRF